MVNRAWWLFMSVRETKGYRGMYSRLCWAQTWRRYRDVLLRRIGRFPFISLSLVWLWVIPETLQLTEIHSNEGTEEMETRKEIQDDECTPPQFILQSVNP